MTECVYQGSFNPIHNAHLEVAKHAREQFGFEKIVFIPAFKPPHKNKIDFNMDNAMHRLNMVQLAVEDYPYFDVSAIEYMRNETSYTYDTIMQIYQIIQPTEKINFIIGTDAFIKIDTWHRADELKHLVDFILFVREDNFDETPFLNLKERGFNYKLMQLPFWDISSTDIRERVKHNKDICDIVPDKVAKYIYHNNVYKI